MVHHVGRSNQKEGLKLSNDYLPELEDSLLRDLKQYFFSSFKEPLYYSFKAVDEELDRNIMYTWANEIFSDRTALRSISQEMAKYLYQKSNHPNIKSGHLFVSYFEDLVVEDEVLSGLVICKAETEESFLQVKYETEPPTIQNRQGIAVNRIDKACIIFDIEADQGYKLCVIDKSNVGGSHFWMEDFLHVEARNDGYYNTKNYIQMTKSFVKDRMQPLYDSNKMDEAEIMNRSRSFFTATENFDESQYVDNVFQRRELTDDFMSYRRDYEEERGIELRDGFDISQEAVKKQSRFFRSVIKLDKNFHIYIHGDRNKIERGVDADGRKYYKVFYDNEA